MLWNSKDELATQLQGASGITNGGIRVDNEDLFRNKDLDPLVKNAVLNPSQEIRGLSRYIIKKVALELGIVPASIQDLYMARGRGEYKGFTVPALNIRGLPYTLNRSIFRTAKKMDSAAFIFELARSEIGYTKQAPHEFAFLVIAAAIKEQYRGPVFIQGDHYQINAKKYHANRDQEMNAVKDLIRKAIEAGVYNIDIDTSTLVTLDNPSVKEQQRLNYEEGVELTHYVRELEPEGVTVSVGGEIGEVGKENSNEHELRAYMDNFNEHLAQRNPNLAGISKISIQTGTSHGGVPLPDGTVAEVNLDFDTLENLSTISRESYGLAGAVQHGASTLPQNLFHKFPELETAEIHLATDFQNMIYDSAHFPREFKEEIYTHLRKAFADEMKDDQTDEQFIYKTRKKGFGEFKSRFWELPDAITDAIGQELEQKMDFLFEKLSAGNTREMVDKSVKPVVVQPDLDNEIQNA